MEPNKYDTDFRNKLNKREIAPSQDSWSKLDAMLNATPEKKKKPMIWLYIAASIIGFVFVGNLFMTQIKDTTTDVEVVNQEKPTDREAIETIQENDSFSKAVIEVESRQEVAKVNEPRSTISKVIAPVKKNVINIAEEEVVIAKVVAIPHKNIRNVVSDDVIDTLLAEASLNQSTGKAQKSVKINARNLLSQVDGEIELTFREKVIKTASKNYQEIKIAVSNRNLESY